MNHHLHFPASRSNSIRLCSRPFLLFILAAALSSPFAQAQVKFAGTQFNIAGNTLSSPSGIAVDGKGNVYIADRNNNRILSVTPSTNGNGTVSTVLSGLSAPAGVAADWTGNLYIADTGNKRILMLPLTKGTLGAPIQVGSGFSNPYGIAIDNAENLYIADSGTNSILQLPRIGNTYGSAIQLITGLNNPTGVAVDAARNIYIAETGNNRVLKENYSAGGYLTQQTVGRGLLAPMGVAVDQNYNVYIADTGNNRILLEPWFVGGRRYNAQAVIGSDVASPAAVVPDWDSNVYVADLGNNQVLEVVTSSVDFSAFPVGANNTTQTYNFNIAAGTVIGSLGIYTQGAIGKDFTDGGATTCVAQTYDATTACGVNVAFSPLASGLRMGAIVFYDAQGNSIATTFVGGTGLQPRAAFTPGTRTILGTDLSGPSGVAIDGYGNVYIADTGNNRIVEVPNNNNSYGTQTTVPVNRLDNPMGIAIDGAGNLYIVSNGNDTILKLPWTGTAFGTQSKVGANFYGPTGIAADSGGNIYIADTLDQFVFRLPWSGNGFTQAMHLGGYVRCPLGVAVDASRNVYFTMPYLNTIQQIPLMDNKYAQQFKTPQIKASLPSAVVSDGNSNIYILDAGNNRVIMAPWNGTSYGNQFTIADGFNSPSGLAVDQQGNLYVADTGNNQVVKIDLSTPQSLSFANTYLGSTSADSAQTVGVTNTGNQPLTVASVTFPADFPSDAQSSTPCTDSSVLSPGTTCQLAIDFTPTTAGSALNELVGIQFDDIAGPQSISVSGVSVGKLAQTINFPGVADVPYGVLSVSLSASSSSNLPVTYQVVSGPATLSRSASSLVINGTGMVIVQAMQGGSSTYAPAASVTISFNVSPAVLTVTPASTTATYGAYPAAFTYTVTGFIAGQSASKVLTGSASVTSNATATSGAGSYVLTATQGTLTAANYTFVFVPGILVISKATLQVHAVSISSTYGSAPGKLAWTFAGFVNGDNSLVITGTPAMSTQATSQSSVGNFPITPSIGTLNAANYNFVFIAGVVSITPASLTVTANSQTFIYGQPMPTMTYKVTGLVNGDTVTTAISGTPTVTTKATSTSGAGTYVVTSTIGTLTAHNYSFTFIPGIVTVSKAVLTITSVNSSMTYGDRLPALTFTASGFVGTDTAVGSITGTPQLSAAANSSTPPGNVAIIVTAGSLTARNYSFVFVPGALTINKALLTVRVNPATMTYGGRAPAVGYTLTGFVNGDRTSTVSGAPSISVQDIASSAVGSYSIKATVGTLTSSLYSFQVTSGTLTIQKAILNVTPDAITMTYGSAPPSPTYKLTGFVNGDGPSVLSGMPAIKTQASGHAHVGTYVIQATPGNLSAANYNFTYGSATATVSKAVATIVADNKTFIYGAKPPAFTYKVTGLMNGDEATRISGTPAFQSSATSRSHVGQYTIAASLGTLNASDYSFAFTNGFATIVKALLTVTPDPVSMTYGSTPPSVTFKMKGFVNGDSSEMISGLPSFSTAISPLSPVGVYVIHGSAGSLTSGDYNFVVKNGTMAVMKAVLTVVPNAAAMTYGSTLPSLSYSVTGFINGDTVKKISGKATITTNASSNSVVGTYIVTVGISGLSSTNYSFSAVQGVLTVNKAVLTVTPLPASMTYGGSVPAIGYSVTGFLNGDTTRSINGTATVSTDATTTSAAGVYASTVNANSLSARNYSFTTIKGVITVKKAVLTITPNAASMTYGSKLPAFSYNASGFVNGDSMQVIKGAAHITTNASATSVAGIYGIAVDVTKLVAANYSFIAAQGVLTVNKAVLTVVAADATMVYGSAIPELKAAFKGFVHGDTQASSITGAAKIATNATTGSTVGSYQTTATIGSLVSANYSFQFQAGSLSVTKSQLTVTADNLSMKVGDAIPALTYAISGLVNGDTAINATSGTAALSTTATAASAVGTYPITAIIGTMKSTNYKLNFVNGTLTVNSK